MKGILVSLVLTSSSLAGAAAAPQYIFSKDMVTQLKGQSVYSAYCQKPVGHFTKEACAIGKKNADFANFKFKNLELVNAKTLRVGDGSRSFEITRGNIMGEFSINGKKIDFAKLTPEEIQNRVSDAIPKLSASFFMNHAEAADAPLSPLAAAVSTMLSKTTDDETCVATQAVIDSCQGDKDASLAMTAMNISSATSDFTQAREISQKVEAAQKMMKAKQAFDAIAMASGVYIKMAYTSVPVMCVVEVKGQKMPAKGALLDCDDQIQKVSAVMDKFIEEFKIKDTANYYKNAAALEKVRASFKIKSNVWKSNDSIQKVRPTKSMPELLNKIPAQQ
jgi:hypothetical protein